MNILVADSGSTKIEWVLIKDSEVQPSIITKGFNPYYYNSDVLKLILLKEFIPKLGNQVIDKIYYYGTGCSSNQAKSIVHTGLQQIFRASDIFIEHDLYGAALALMKDEKGIACILGTGTNSCVFENGKITHNIPSLGYLLADEGSGTDLGKILLNAYLKKELPAHLLQAFKDKYALKDEHILKEIYAHDQPNQYIASYTYFLSEHKEHPKIQELIKSSFDSFFKTYIVKYPDYTKLPVRFIGSIANEFGDLLKRSAQKFDIKIDLILKNPMEGLIDYHKSN